MDSGLGDLAHGEGAAQGRECSWSSGSSCPDAGPWVLVHRDGKGDNPFSGKHLSDVSWASYLLGNNYLLSDYKISYVLGSGPSLPHQNQEAHIP